LLGSALYLEANLHTLVSFEQLLIPLVPQDSFPGVHGHYQAGGSSSFFRTGAAGGYSQNCEDN